MKRLMILGLISWFITLVFFSVLVESAWTTVSHGTSEDKDNGELCTWSSFIIDFDAYTNFWGKDVYTGYTCAVLVMDSGHSNYGVRWDPSSKREVDYGTWCQTDELAVGGGITTGKLTCAKMYVLDYQENKHYLRRDNRVLRNIVSGDPLNGEAIAMVEPKKEERDAGWAQDIGMRVAETTFTVSAPGDPSFSPNYYFHLIGPLLINSYNTNVLSLTSFLLPGNYDLEVRQAGYTTSGRSFTIGSQEETVSKSIKLCKLRSYTDCYNGDVYWYDACGHRGTRRYICDGINRPAVCKYFSSSNEALCICNTNADCPGNEQCTNGGTIGATCGDCTPNCIGKVCGSDGCGGSCGTCSGEQVCNVAGQCVGGCTDDCEVGEKKCHSTEDNQYHVCGYYDIDSCLDWSSAQTCAFGKICLGEGNCVDYTDGCVGDTWACNLGGESNTAYLCKGSPGYHPSNWWEKAGDCGTYVCFDVLGCVDPSGSDCSNPVGYNNQFICDEADDALKRCYNNIWEHWVFCVEYTSEGGYTSPCRDGDVFYDEFVDALKNGCTPVSEGCTTDAECDGEDYCASAGTYEIFYDYFCIGGECKMAGGYNECTDYSEDDCMEDRCVAPNTGCYGEPIADGTFCDDCANIPCECQGGICISNIVCGDGICSSPTEDCGNCPQDCCVPVSSFDYQGDAGGEIDCPENECWIIVLPGDPGWSDVIEVSGGVFNDDPNPNWGPVCANKDYHLITGSMFSVEVSPSPVKYRVVIYSVPYLPGDGFNIVLEPDTENEVRISVPTDHLFHTTTADVIVKYGKLNIEFEHEGVNIAIAGIEISSYCGDSAKKDDEQCDDGIVDISGDAGKCIIDPVPGGIMCQWAKCGDGYLSKFGADGVAGGEDDEECDDGNNRDGDGCDSDCMSELDSDFCTEHTEKGNIVPTTPPILATEATCEDYNDVDGEISFKEQLCNECSVIVAHSQATPQELSPSCVWVEGCVFQYKEVDDTLCTIRRVSTGECGPDNMREITYTNTCDEACLPNSGNVCTKQVICPKAVQLPFFNTTGFIVSLIIIALIYLFYNYFIKKKGGKKAKR